MSEKQLNALVTGSGRNIGRSIALDLAGKGMNVVVHGKHNQADAESVAAEVRALGVKAHVIMGDLGDADAVQGIADQALEACGSVHVLINNAAIRPQSSLIELSAHDWHEVMNVNLNSAFSLCKAFVPGMQTAGFGRIVMFSGMNAINGYAGRCHVSASKHALWGLCKALAKELGPDGISVNTISPGPTEGEHPDDPEMTRHIAGQIAKIPRGRLGRPEEVAALCGFLCSPEGGLVSGQMIACNGAAQS